MFGLQAFTKRHDSSTFDSPQSSRDIADAYCSVPDQGKCLKKRNHLYVADYPDQAEALALLQRMDRILKRLYEAFEKTLKDISSIDVRYRLQWANKHGLRAADESELKWQLERIERFLRAIPSVTIGEVIKQNDSDLTSYTIDKRDLSMCLRDKQTNRLYEDNLITYVFLHELSHIMSPTVGHDETFIKCFRIMLNMAVYSRLYVQVDWSRNPVTYCGGIYLNSTVWA